MYAGEKYLSYVFKKKIETDSHFSHKRRKGCLDFWDQRSQDSIICFSTWPIPTRPWLLQHIRWSLQALSFLPSDDRLGTLRASCSNLYVIRVLLSPNGKWRKKEKGKRAHSAEETKWIIGCQLFGYWMGRTSSCMRCGRSFGWRRRRHRCRLCGCASCS